MFIYLQSFPKQFIGEPKCRLPFFKINKLVISLLYFVNMINHPVCMVFMFYSCVKYTF